MVNPTRLTPSPQQLKAWGFYGIPRGAAQSIGTKAPTQAVGEVRYVIGWMADQMVRMGWRVLINGNESWTLSLPDGVVITSNGDQDDAELPDHPANASRVLLEAVGWGDAMVRTVTTNLFVAGELYYVHESNRWQAVSMIDPKLDDKVKKATLEVHGLWPHPADPDSPDAPLFGVLAVLDDMLWLTRLERSQSANRVAMRGIIGIADQLRVASSPDSSTEQFWKDFEAALSRPMDDAEDVSPVGLVGAAELVKPEGSGMAGLSWLIPEFPYDERIDKRLEAAIQRLAYGLPIPPELLLGMQAQSRATAFQVEEAGYRAHVEPAAWTVAQIPQDALSALLPETLGKVAIVPDPSAILARRVTTENAFESFDRDIIGEDYLREVLGIPARAKVESTEVAEEALPADPAVMLAFELVSKAPSLFSSVGLGEIIRQIQEVLDGNPEAASVQLPDDEEAPADPTPVDDDPASEAADEAVNAAVALPVDASEEGTVPQSADDAYLGELLERIDERLLSELVGASEQAVVKVREKIGAQVRSSKRYSAQIPDELSNADLALELGAAAASELGVDVARATQTGLESVLSWWRKRLARAQADIIEVLAVGGIDLTFSASAASDSEIDLERKLTLAVFSPDELNADALRHVIETAGT